MSSKIDAAEKAKVLRRISSLRRRREKLERAEAALTFPDVLIESEIEDIEEEIWELEQGL
jgi:hypothetical protein